MKLFRHFTLLVLFCIISANLNAQQTPFLSYPNDGGPVYSLSPTLYWYNNSGEQLTYNLQVSTDAGFSNIILNVNNLTSINYTVGNLEEGTTYYWRVRSKLGMSYSAFSTVWRFVTPGVLSYRISATAGEDGSISPSGITKVPAGTSQTFTIEPDYDAIITDVIIDNVSIGTPGSYTFNNVTENHTISAFFRRNHYNITASAGANGTIFPSGTSSVAYNDDITYSINPAPGYHIDNVLVDGVSVGAVASYTFNDIEDDHSIEVVFSNVYRVTITANSGGSVSPIGVQTLTTHSDLYITVKAETGYIIEQIIIDGAIQTPAADQMIYSLTNVIENHTVDVVFARKTFTISVSPGGSGGTITPSGIITVNYGEDLTVHFNPLDGFKTLPLFVDGVSVPPAESYTFTHITQNHTLSTSFSAYGKKYVANGGNDANDGSEENPLATIDRALEVCHNFGDEIHVGPGSFLNSVVISSPVTIIGSGRGTILSYIYVASSHVTIRDLDMQPTINDVGIYCNTSIMDLTLENIQFRDYYNAIFLMDIDGLVIKNCDIRNTSGYGINLGYCRNIDLENLFIQRMLGHGLLLDSCNDIHLDNVKVTNSLNAVTSGNMDAGFKFVGIQDGVFNNLRSERVANGILIGGCNNIMIKNSFLALVENGITVDPALYLSNTMHSSTNLTLDGIDADSCLYSGITLNGYQSYSISDVNILNSNFSFLTQGISAIRIYGNVSNCTFEKCRFDKAVYGASILGHNSSQPVGIKINHSIFSQTPTAITLVPSGSLTGSPAIYDVDGRFNDFYDAQSMQDIPYYIMDRLDAPPNTAIGLVDISGAGFGPLPGIKYESVPEAYKGASYFIDVNIDVKHNEYLWLRGTINYDSPNLLYLGYVSDGLINDAGWVMNVTQTSAGVLDFNAYGTDPVKEDGTLFRLYFRVANDAPGFSACISSFSQNLYGNNENFEFGVYQGYIDYRDAPGPIQSKGDITLNCIVDDDDFMALLYHLNGSALITDPQALDNADFDDDGDIDGDDRDALYAFLNPSPPVPGAPAGEILASSGNCTDRQIEIPVDLVNAVNIRSLELTLNFNENEVEFQSFSKNVTANGYFVHAMKTGTGQVKFYLNAQNSINGNLELGKITLMFPDNAIPNGSRITTSYIINNRPAEKGSDILIGESTTDVIANIIPQEFSLSQNYPNPFNPTTTIEFALPEASAVNLTIYNMLGQEVKTLVNDEKQAGFYSIQWNGEDNGGGSSTASGIYIYRISAGKNVISKKMIFLK